VGEKEDSGLKDVTPLFFVSVASKGFSFSVNPLESTLTDILVSVADKGVRGGRLRPKLGKTRCLSVSAHSKGLSGECVVHDGCRVDE